MVSKHKSKNCKKSAVEYYLFDDKSQLEVFKYSAQSLMRWFEKYEKEDEIKRHNWKPVAYKVVKNILSFY